MAIETALKFLERMEREETLRTQLYISRPENLHKLTEFARGKGFIISMEDLEQALVQYEEKYPTGSLAPLKQYVDDWKALPDYARNDILGLPEPTTAPEPATETES